MAKMPSRNLDTEGARAARVELLKQHTQCALARVSQHGFVPERLSNNIEAFIGSIEVPVGVVGPLLIHLDEGTRSVYAPFATTEGALVASATRGATAVSLSGGVNTRFLGQKMSRVPCFEMSGEQEVAKLSRWLRDNTDELKSRVPNYSSHANLIHIEHMPHGRFLFLSFDYTTGDAAGQNMTTSCTWHLCLWICQQLGIPEDSFIIESSYSGDKRVCFRTLTLGRGCKVTAECSLSTQLLKRVLKTTPDKLMTAYGTISHASTSAGAIGFNINVANVVAAIFAATGQDLACIHESAISVLKLIRTNAGITATLTMPALVVGVVGGGTSLPKQRECLQLMGCESDRGGVRVLSQMIAGFALALDLSTLSAASAGHFAIAHDLLGRNRPQAANAASAPTPCVHAGEALPEAYLETSQVTS